MAVGACAINGGLPAMRNFIPLEECLNELPLLLDKVRPLHEVIKIDYFLPGCPPSADVFWKFLTDLLEGRESSLPYEWVHYD